MQINVSQNRSLLMAGSLLVVMGCLMLPLAHEDSATVDETTFLAAGYTYWTGHRYYLAPEHPPLSQMLSSAPLMVMNVKLSDNARALLEGRAGYPWTRPWLGPVRAVQELFPQGRSNWYFWALPESQLFGQMFVYDGTNDGDAMMLAGRCVQILLTIGVGLLIFWWIRWATNSDSGALAGLAAWVFNPNALAHGHLTTTDMGATFGMTAATFAFAHLLEAPTRRAAILCGVATGLALLMKFTAIILAPIFVVLALIHWKTLRGSEVPLWKLVGFVILCAWAVVMVMYFPRWSPAPPLPEEQARALGVPSWFTSLRTLLIPPDFFKGLALTLGHSKEGHEAFLLGRWSHSGWWYYYPLTFVLKSSVAFVLLVILCCVMFLRSFKSARAGETVPWVAALIYLLLAMTSNVNIGVRHLLPMFPWLCVGIGCVVPRLIQLWLKKVAVVLVLWQAVVIVICYPSYLQFFSEAVGGAQNGHNYLVDSNYDWGQDANRLKKFIAAQGIQHIYLNYFGTQFSIEHLGIPNTRVNAEQAQQIRSGYLVVSASELMRPEWDWLRNSRTPAARVAYTLFLYRFP